MPFKLLPLIAAALLMALAPAPSALARGAIDVSEGFADLADRLLPTVVNISTTQSFGGPSGPSIERPEFPPGSPFEDFFREFFERGPNPTPRRANSLGSGFVVDAENGYVVTNNHVIAEADEVTVILHDDSSVEAEIIGRDPKTDLAVLKIDPEGLDLRAVEWGDSDAMRVGDWVMAIGNPFGLGGTVTAGIISARARNINAGPYDDFLQTDASINRGNSGGPMFNTEGGVIGINTAIFSPTGGSVGIGFAIPSALARPVIDQLIEFGRTRRGWLGVRIQEVTGEIADSLGLDGARGALVASVTPGGPAEQAGIEAGDVILEFDGREVPEMRRLPRIVADTRIGKQAPVVLWRKGERERVEVEVGELEEAEASGLLTASAPGDMGTGRMIGELGLTLSTIDPAVIEEFDLREGLEGVVITRVEPGSAAAENGLRPGDVILEINQESVTEPASVASMVEDALESGRRSLLLLIDRNGENRFLALSIDQE